MPAGTCNLQEGLGLLPCNSRAARRRGRRHDGSDNPPTSARSLSSWRTRDGCREGGRFCNWKFECHFRKSHVQCH